MVTQEFDLNLIPSSEPVVVHVNQYDYGSGRFIINLWEGSTEYTPESGTTVLIEGHKPDGNVFSYSEADGVSLTGNVVTAPCFIQMTAVEGRTRVNLILSNSGTRIGSFVFWLDVQETPVNESAPVSETEIPAIIALAESQAERAESAADTAVEASSEAEASKVSAAESAMTAGTSATSASESATSAEESATSATASATSAGTSATNASESAGDAEAWAVGKRGGVPVPPTDPQYENSAQWWAEQAQQVADIHLMDNSTTGIGRPDGKTAEATNGIFSAIGTTIVGTVNPSASAEYASDWLLDANNVVITPEARRQYRVDIRGKAMLFYWDGTEYAPLGSSGHTIISSSMLPIGGSTLPMAGRGNLQFGGKYDPVFTEDDENGDTTIVHGQLFICDSESDWNTLSDADFKAKYGADREQAGVYWYLPWANSIAYQTDLTPVGTVLSLAVDTTNTTIFPADLIEFPNKDYVICRGATVKISDYPLLYQYFEDEYGDGNYFGNSQTAEGYFVLPNWSADFPTNGVLVIKARITSDVITFAEVDDEAVTAENVWSAEKTDEEISGAVSDLGIKGQSLGAIPTGMNKKYNIDNFSGIIYTSHPSSVALGYAAIVASSGFVKELTSSSAVSASASSGVLTISNNASAGTAAVFAIILSGSITAQTS